MDTIRIKNAQQNNLKQISVEIPHKKFIVVTGVSGSGKSSLAFDVINKEGQRQFFVNLSAQARKYLGKLQKPKVDSIEGLTPTISIAQRSTNNNPRSTVGTMTEIYDNLRLLFARLGHSLDSSININRSLFSFNSTAGACPNCQGLGLEDKISVQLLLEDEGKTIREGCFRITNPDGYIIYSQVRMDELEKVCQANGFSVDIPWNGLSTEQQDVVLNGSEKIKILYGKHSLESRMKWTGIKANPREEEFYKGILPVMNQILKRDRNPNILRFAKTEICSVCNGSRLKNEASEVTVLGWNIYQFSNLALHELESRLSIDQFPESQKEIALPIVKNIQKRIANLKLLGLDYLNLNRAVSTLSAGEMQSIRLASQLNSKLCNVTYVFDEPSVGLHPSKNKNVIKILKQLVAQGNTVIVVEHDAETIRNADWIIEIGPKAGQDGGALLFNGDSKDFFNSDYKSITKSYLNKEEHISFNTPCSNLPQAFFSIKNACINNLKKIDVNFLKQALNVVTGVSGAGKSSLIHQSLVPLIQEKYQQQINAKGAPTLINFDFDKTLIVEQAPIGKTARSTPATYTKLFDLIRDFFAKLPESKAQKLNKSTFSFNTKGGRCEHCEGAGKIEIGMHFLGNVESQCPVCFGTRFNANILDIKHQDKSISDVLKMTVVEASAFFEGNNKIEKHLNVLTKIGLGYIQLGQSSNTLSGGEAQRVRLASELVKENASNQLFIFDEPTTGLHFSDIQKLLNVFMELIEKGNTILLIEHNEDVIKIADRIIDLGPGSAANGGNLIFEGQYKDFIQNKKSTTAQALKQLKEEQLIHQATEELVKQIELKGIKTNNLKGIDICIPHKKHTVIVGKSGSGKSSLAFDTIYAEAQNSFTESFPTYIQQFARQKSQAQIEYAKGLTPSIALKQNNKISDPRSTIGTLTGISDNLRLLMSRFGTAYCSSCGKANDQSSCSNCGSASNLDRVDTKKASNYSFNQVEGACTECKGLGEILSSSPDLLIENSHLSFTEGALVKSKLLDSYVNVNEKYMATLLEVGKQKNIDFHLPTEALSPKAIQIAFYGTGNEEFEVEWEYKTKTDSGIHQFKGVWIGFVDLLLDEYYRRHANGKGLELMPLLSYQTCPLCNGQRFKPEILNIRFLKQNIHELSNLKITDLLSCFQSAPVNEQNTQVIGNLIEQLKNIKQFNLGYLHLDRKSNSLSGGELQRILLSSQLKGSLTGLTYILDEPSSGLHPADISSISQNIKDLIDKGNTVITVEHQADLIRTADHVIELGPESGENGGKLQYSGHISNYLNKKKESKLSKDFGFFEANDQSNNSSSIQISRAKIHNLNGTSASFIKNKLNVISGVSGSGKTTLMRDVLLKSQHKAINCDKLDGLDEFSELLWIDRNSMEQSSLSSLATYLGLLDDIKKVFTPILKGSGIKASQLSYNNKSGQCPDCKGQGYIKTKMDFLNDIQSLCESCNGQRYKSEILKLKWKEHNIADLLQMTVSEAFELFYDQANLSKKLSLLKTLGLSYLKLGQNSQEFSGGEAQRIKITKELLSSGTHTKLYVFDEASRGLHEGDLVYLLNTFAELIQKGHTVIAIEHHPSIIKKAQHLVDLHQGAVIYEGPVMDIKSIKESLTGQFL